MLTSFSEIYLIVQLNCYNVSCAMYQAIEIADPGLMGTEGEAIRNIHVK